jgi:hypothetical protein
MSPRPPAEATGIGFISSQVGTFGRFKELRKKVNLQTRSASFCESVRVCDNSRVDLLQFPLKRYRDGIAAVTHASKTEGCRKEVLLKEVRLVERKSISRANKGD